MIKTHKFDFPFLVSAALRQKVSLDPLAGWRYVDTLQIMKAVDHDMFNGCVKLQCVMHVCDVSASLRAHRALDDAIGLERVLSCISGRLGVSLPVLTRPFTVGIDAVSTFAQFRYSMDVS